MTSKKTPRETLEAIWRRSGMSGTAVAKAAGYSSASGFYKLTQEKHQGDRPIPHDSIVRLIAVFRGRGSPPITIDELLAISDGVPSGMTPSGHDTVSAPYAAAVEEAVARAVGGALTTKYRVEDGVYFDPSRDYNHGPSPIAMTPQYPASGQFAVLCINGGDRIPPMTYLHCTRRQAPLDETCIGRTVVVLVPAHGGGIVEAALGVVVKHGAGDIQIISGGKPVTGTVAGVVIGQYTRV